MRRYTVPMQPQASQPQVLIAGAGPTGLVLALCLARRGVAVRIVDQASGPGLASRAMVVHARTLEFYRQLGFAQQVVDLGIPIHAVHLREDGEEAAELPLGDIGAGLSPYPFVLSFPQDEHERLLVDQLRAAGVEVEWNTALEHFEQDEWGVRATLLQGDQRINTSAAYLCGCDGVHSSTRHALGVAFDGGTYDNLYYVADVHTDCANRDLMVHLDANSFALMLPVRTAGMQRLIGIVPQTEHANVIFDDLRPRLEALLGIAIDQVNWFSTYRVHHRVAGRFRVDRVFLAGGADASLLDTYEPERSAFARKLVATTDRAFELIVAQGAGGRLLRNWLVPHVLPALAGFDAARRALFRTVSQVRIHYHDSGLSGGRAGEIIGGDRLPWVPGQGGEAGPDNFAPMQTLDWQLHVYGAVDPQLAALATALRLPLRAWPWTEAAEQAGLLEDAAYLLRPDMHVALALPRQETDVLQELIARWGLRFGDDAQAATATGWRSQADT